MGRITEDLYPTALRARSIEKLEALAAQLRQELLDSVPRTGGHLASSLGAVETAIALHREFRPPKDKIIWDIGHQTYAHKMLTGRRRALGSLRRRGGISGFLKRRESI